MGLNLKFWNLESLSFLTSLSLPNYYQIGPTITNTLLLMSNLSFFINHSRFDVVTLCNALRKFVTVMLMRRDVLRSFRFQQEQRGRM